MTEVVVGTPRCQNDDVAVDDAGDDDVDDVDAPMT